MPTVTVAGIQHGVVVEEVVKKTVLKGDCLGAVVEVQMMERHVRLRVWLLEQQEKGPLRWMEARLEELVDGAAVELLNALFRW